MGHGSDWRLMIDKSWTVTKRGVGWFRMVGKRSKQRDEVGTWSWKLLGCLAWSLALELSQSWHC